MGAGEVIEVVDPASEQVIGSVPASTEADARAAVTAAAAAFAEWSATSPQERAELLRAWHARLTERSAELAALVTSELGAPPAIAERVHVGLPLTTLAFHAELLGSYAFEETVGPSLVVKAPAGVVVAVTPWNYPLHQAMAKVAPALAAGCTVVLKPSELAPLAVDELVAEAHAVGIPEGVLSVVHGTGASVPGITCRQPCWAWDRNGVGNERDVRAGRRLRARGRRRGRPGGRARAAPRRARRHL